MKTATAWLYITNEDAARLLELQDYEEPGEIEAFGSQIIRMRSSDGKWDLKGPASSQRQSDWVLKLEFRDGTAKESFPWDQLAATGILHVFHRWNADCIEGFTITNIGEGHLPSVENCLQA